jgi:hypothetical protein
MQRSQLSAHSPPFLHQITAGELVRTKQASELLAAGRRKRGTATHTARCLGITPRAEKKKEIGTMSAKILPVLVAASLLGTTALASAQVAYAPYGYNYNYYGYVPAYPPAVALGPGVGPGIYYAPGYYSYAPAYVAPVYTGWNNVWNYW